MRQSRKGSRKRIRHKAWSFVANLDRKCGEPGRHEGRRQRDHVGSRFDDVAQGGTAAQKCRCGGKRPSDCFGLRRGHPYRAEANSDGCEVK